MSVSQEESLSFRQERMSKRYYDPDRCVVSYTLDKRGDHSVISIILGNILDKPVKQILLSESADLPLSAKKYCTTANSFPGAKITTVTYDAYGRKASSTSSAHGAFSKGWYI